jgi:hypothetical protein
MSTAFTPLFANGLIMLEVAFVWCPAVAVTTFIAILALVLAVVRRILAGFEPHADDWFDEVPHGLLSCFHRFE